MLTFVVSVACWNAPEQASPAGDAPTSVSAAGDANTAANAPAAQDVLVTGDIRTGVSGCDTQSVATRLGALFDAIGEGRADIAEAFFGYRRDAPFRWFSFTEQHTGGRGHYVTYDASRLNAHFAERRAANERIVLRAVQFNRYDSGLLHFGPVDFDFSTPDSAGDRVTYSGRGKGAYDCSSAAFVVLSLGTTG